MAEDRRVRKTKKAIQDAFCEMSKDKKLNEITIKELCARADINKSTFYLHYRDIYDLANSIQEILIQDVCAIIEEYPYDETIRKAPEMWKRIADTHFKDSNDLGMLMQRPGMQPLVREFERAVIDVIMNKFVEAGMRENSEAFFQHHLYVTFIINGYVGVLREFDVSEMEAAMLEVSKRLDTGFSVEL
ncbi:MAG: TetR/AcrR family transcriptional regulator [Lachnospiraceae bacterium]|nr:TetR/AcrR family transcriptional regulator [Lachnospiraceae bacterium]